MDNKSTINQPVAAKIDIDKVVVDTSYQRSRSLAALHAKIASDFSWGAFGRPLIGKRETDHGTEYFVIDGQQRINALRASGYKGQIPVLFVENADRVREAELFSKVNADRAPVNAVERFRAAVVAGREPEKTIQDFFSANGFVVVDTANSTGHVNCVTKVKAIWTLSPDDAKRALVAAMRLCEGGGIHTMILAACFALIRRNVPLDDPKIISSIKKRFDRDTLAATLNNVPRAIGSSTRGCSVGVQSTLLDIVNYGRRDRFELGPVASKKTTGKGKTE